MRTVNYPLLIFLVVAMGVVSGAAYVLHGFQLRRNAGVLLREAAAAQERDDRKQAIEWLERYITLVPDHDLKHLVELGELQAGEKREAQAARTFEAVLRRDSRRTDIRRKLVELQLGLGQTAGARHHLNILLEASPDDPELIGELGRCQYQGGEFSDAAETLSRAIELAPHELKYHSQLANLYATELQAQLRALTILNTMVSQNENNAHAYVIRGSHRLDFRQEIAKSLATRSAEPEEVDKPDDSGKPQTAYLRAAELASDQLSSALDDARKALELDADNEEVLIFSIRCFLENQKTADVLSLAKRGVELHPKVAYFYSVLSDAERMAGRRDAALDWFNKGLEELPNNSDLIWNQSRMLVDEGRIDEVNENLRRLRKLKYPRHAIAFLEARNLVAQGQWFDASKLLESTRPSLVGIPRLSKEADLWLGECYLRLGRPDLQLVAQRRAAEADPAWIPARLGIAQALISTGRISEALEEYEHVAALPHAPAVVLAQLTRLTVLMNLRANPSKRDWDRPHRILDTLERIDPASSSIAILRAEILVGQGRSEQAERVLTEARNKSPKNLDYWIALASLLEEQNEAGRVEEVLSEAKEHNGDSVALRLAEARHLVYRSHAEAQSALRRFSEQVDDFSDEERLELYSGLANLTLAVGDFEETERLGLLVAEQQPTNLRVRLLLFDLAFRSKRLAAMEEALQQVQSIERSGPLWHYGEAVRLCVVAENDQRAELYSKARDHLQEARISRPAWSRIPMLQAQIYQKQGKDNLAIESYIQAIDLGERDPVAVSRAVGMLYQRRRFVEADRLIRKLQEQQSPFSNEMLRIATEISLRLNDRDRALALVIDNASESQDPLEQIWAGRILSSLGRADDAEKRFRGAVEQAPQSSETWVALIQHFGRTQQSDKAEEAIHAAQQALPSESQAITLAQAYESIGRLEDAENQYRAAISSDPTAIALKRRLADFYIREQKAAAAEPLLRQILESESDLTQDDQIWCRRNLAYVLLSQGVPKLTAEGLTLIERNLAVLPDSQTDLRAKAMALSLLPDQKSRRDAAALFETLLKNDGTEASNEWTEPRFILAQLYVSLDDHAAAIPHLRKLLASHGDDLRFSTYYVRFLLAQGELGEAELWMRQVQKQAPKEISTVLLAVELLVAQHHVDQVIPAIDTFLETVPTDSPGRKSTVQQLANALERAKNRLPELANFPPASVDEWSAKYVQRAQEIWEAAAKDTPTDSLSLAAFLGRSGKHDEAQKLLLQELEQADPSSIATVASTVLGSRTSTPESLDQAASILKTALSRHVQSVVLMLALADVLNWSEKYAEAEKLYREVLAIAPDNPIVLNNLAVLLAMRSKGGMEPLALIDRALKNVGDNPALLDTRSTIYLSLGDLRRAAEDLDLSLSTVNSAAGQFRKALIEFRLGHMDLSREAFAKAHAQRLRVEELHPLERPLYRQLERDLK